MVKGELQGTTSTRNAIELMKEIFKCPEKSNTVDFSNLLANNNVDLKPYKMLIILEISHQGVKFLDINTKVNYY